MHVRCAMLRLRRDGPPRDTGRGAAGSVHADAEDAIEGMPNAAKRTNLSELEVVKTIYQSLGPLDIRCFVAPTVRGLMAYPHPT